MLSINMPQSYLELGNLQGENTNRFSSPQTQKLKSEQAKWLSWKPASLKVPTDWVMVEDKGLFHSLSSSQ
jgi:hypothetical protein